MAYASKADAAVLKARFDRQLEEERDALVEMMARARVVVPAPSAVEWLTRWDAGESVESTSMGGLGDEYEQAIQTTAAEILRWWIEHEPKDVLDPDALESAMLTCSDATASPVADLHLSGAQWGAARALARVLYDYGPGVFTDNVASGKTDAARIIMVQASGTVTGDS